MSKAVYTERSATDAAKAQEIALESLAHPQDDYLEYVFNETNKTLEDRVAKAAGK